MTRSRKHNKAKRRHSIRKRRHSIRKRNTSKGTRHNKRRNGGSILGLGIRMKPFLPECEPFHPTVYKDYKGVKSILSELQKREDPITHETQESINIANILFKNCILMKKYMMFWDQAQAEIVEHYGLGDPEPGKRRIVDFIIKMYKKTPLSPNLQQKWDAINSPTPNPPGKIPLNNPFTIPSNFVPPSYNGSSLNTNYLKKLGRR